jgi:flagellar protein FlaG
MMDTGIKNISRTINQVPSELESKKLHPAEKMDEAKRVLVEQQTKKLESEGVEKNEKKEALNKDELADVVTKINTAFQNEKRSIQFKLDDDSGRTIIKVVDQKTGEEIKQIPSEEMLEISRRLSDQLDKEDLSGMLIKSRA